MSRTTRVFAALAAAVALVPAATAEAKTAKAAKAKTVATHLQRAQVALDDVRSAVESGDRADARAAVKAARRDATFAARKARTLAANAGTSDAAAQQAVWSLAGAAGQYGQAMSEFAALIPGASADLQSVLANAIPGSVAGRQQLIDLLSALTARLGGDAQALAAKALAALQQQAPAQTAELADAADYPALPAGIGALLDHALATATAMLDDGLGVLKSVLGDLPAEDQAPVTSALSTITTLIPQVVQTVTAVIPSVLDLVTGVLNTVTGLVTPSAAGTGAAVPATPATGTGTATSGLGGLLGGLTKLVPGFGGLLGGLLGQ